MYRKHHKQHSLLALVALSLLCLSVAACGQGNSTVDDQQADGGGAQQTAATVSIVGINASQAMTVALKQGFFEDENLDVKSVPLGQADEVSLFLAGEADIASMAPWAVARLNAQGENLRLLTTASGENLMSGVVVRAEDATKYQTMEDLVGKSLGMPGQETDTWLSFKTMLQMKYDIDASNAYDIVTAESGALMALLDSGQIDAALVFPVQVIAAMVQSDKYDVVMTLTDVMQQLTGQPLIAVAPVARAEWASKNKQVIKRLEKALDRAVAWIKSNFDEFAKDGKYARVAELDGWHATPSTFNRIQNLVVKGQFIFTSEAYTPKYIDGTYRFIERGEGIIVDEAPPKDDIFYGMND